MLKENHVRAAGSLASHPRRPHRATHAATDRGSGNLAQLDEALAEGYERILIDDFDASRRQERSVAPRHRHSMGASRWKCRAAWTWPLRGIAADGVDFVSIGES